METERANQRAAPVNTNPTVCLSRVPQMALMIRAIDFYFFYRGVKIVKQFFKSCIYGAG